MSLDAKVDLSGTIKEWRSLNEAGISVTPNLLKETQSTRSENDTIWMGSGCFGIAEDPVIYVSQEDLLSVSNSISIIDEGSTYTAKSFPTDSVRLVSFLDPRSVKVCLNTDAYHDIDSLYVVINYGVDVNRPVDNTDSYRKMLKLASRPTFSIMPKGGGDKLTTKSKPMLTVMPKSDVLKNDFYTETEPDSVKFDRQTGSDLPFYGRFETVGDKRVVMDPQVFVPYKPNTSTVNQVIVPDFVVTVSVMFKCREVPDGVFFSHCYIPKVELIGHDDITTFYNELKEYSDMCANKQSVATLYNDPNVKVYNTTGEIMLTKTLNILRKCANIKD